MLGGELPRHRTGAQALQTQHTVRHCIEMPAFKRRVGAYIAAAYFVGQAVVSGVALATGHQGSRVGSGAQPTAQPGAYFPSAQAVPANTDRLQLGAEAL